MKKYVVNEVTIVMVTIIIIQAAVVIRRVSLLSVFVCMPHTPDS